MSNLMIDIDDTAMPWFSTVDAHCRERLGPDTPPARRWAMHEDYQIELSHWVALVDELCVPDGLYHTAPYPGVAEIVRALAWEGHRIFWVTARGFMANAEQIREWTSEWLEEWALPGMLIFAKDKDRVALELEIDHAIDDGYHNFQMLDAAGIDVTLMNQPHNADAPVPPERRVDSVAEWGARFL